MSFEIPIEKLVDGEVVVVDTKTIPIIPRKNVLIPHESGADRKRINVMLAGKKVGMATVTTDGTLSVLLTDESIAELISPKRELQHFSIMPTYKA
jgi:hypothetical protein